MYLQLFERLSLNICLIVTVAYLVSKTKIFNRSIRGRSNTGEKITLILLFGLLGIVGTYIGVPIKGTLANSRVVGVVAGGLLGGPVIGLAAGLLAGGHRFLLGGATAFSCGIATVLNGLIAGYIAKKASPKILNWQQTLLVGIGTETLEMLMILLFSRPFPSGLERVEVIGLPMIIMNSIGIVIFYAIVQNALIEEERIGAVQAQKALQIANNTLSILRLGLNMDTAQKVAKIIFDTADYAGVGITNRERILAHVGSGADHHRPGEEIMNAVTFEAIASGELKLAANRKEIGCSHKECPLFSALVIPLRCRDSIIGTLKFYREKDHIITQVDWEFAAGLGMLFSTQLELAELEAKSRLVSKAELRALQAQINPHFLFNAINTIVSYCRTDSEKARDLLLQLGDFFRKNLQSGDRLVSLSDELEHIHSYTGIELARFSEKLTVREFIAEETLKSQLPGLTLQPLVENAIKHGIYPLNQPGEVVISSRHENEYLVIEIKDNGVGIPEDKLARILSGEQVPSKGLGIGLNNVFQRLNYIYQGKAFFSLKSKMGEGTVVNLRIPRTINANIS
jgi:two-component system sensor histidine kinase LytS